MSNLNASLAPDGEVILSMSWSMLLELRAVLHVARENHETINGKFIGSSTMNEYLLAKHLRWEVRLDDAVDAISSSLPNVKVVAPLPAGADVETGSEA